MKSDSSENYHSLSSKKKQMKILKKNSKKNHVEIQDQANKDM